MSGVDIFEHVGLCGQMADTSSNYCDDIYSHMTRDVSVFVKCVTIFKFFLEITTISYFWLSQGSAATYWRYGWKYYMGFAGNLLGFPAVKELRNPLRIGLIDKVIAMNLVCSFLGHPVLACFPTVWDILFLKNLLLTIRPTTIWSLHLKSSCNFLSLSPFDNSRRFWYTINKRHELHLKSSSILLSFVSISCRQPCFFFYTIYIALFFDRRQSVFVFLQCGPMHI